MSIFWSYTKRSYVKVIGVTGPGHYFTDLSNYPCWRPHVSYSPGSEFIQVFMLKVKCQGHWSHLTLILVGRLHDPIIIVEDPCFYHYMFRRLYSILRLMSNAKVTGSLDLDNHLKASWFSHHSCKYHVSISPGVEVKTVFIKVTRVNTNLLASSLNHHYPGSHLYWSWFWIMTKFLVKVTGVSSS